MFFFGWDFFMGFEFYVNKGLMMNRCSHVSDNYIIGRE